MSDKYSVIGIRHSSGSYEGKKFDNYYFHCIRPADESRGESGQICEIFEKIKASNLSDIPCFNDFIIPVYNRFGKVETVRIV